MLFVFFIHDGLRRQLFSDVARKALQQGIAVKIFCFSLREYHWFKTKGFSKEQITTVKQFPHDTSILDIEKTIDVSANFISTKSASAIYSSTLNMLSQFDGVNEEIIIFAGNGLHAFDKAVLTYKQDHENVFTLFTELANIEGKVFFDNTGSNASSRFYRMLKNNEIAFPDYDVGLLDTWKRTYYNEKLKKHHVMQSPQKRIMGTILYRLIGCVEFILNTPSYQKFKITELLCNRKKIGKKLYSEEWDKYTDNISSLNNYILFPLQVFGDSQIKLHSKVDNEEAMKIAIREAQEKCLPLVVKPHPAEPDRVALDTVLRLKDKYGFYVSTNNTFELIGGATKIIVINSTVGLEAIICGKDVEFLGDSFYCYFKDDRALSYYLNHWLVDIDIFQEQTISDVVFSKIISIAKS